MLSDTTIQQTKAIPLTDIVSQYVKLKRTGSEYSGLCPFHDERTASFTVHPAKGFKCFGCNTGGANAVDFIMQIEKLSFPDAVIRVASLAGLYVDDSQPAAPKPVQRKPAPKPQQVDTIPPEAIRANIEAFSANHLYTFLVGKFGSDTADRLAGQYCFGSCNWFGKGTTLFYQQDEAGNIRHLKAILYDPATGKRRKEKEFEPKIIGRQVLAKHTGRNYDDVNLVQCYYGQHLLNGNSKPAALVESEKSAMIASLFYPQYNWLATGGKSGAKWYSKEMCKALAGRPIILFPDADAVEDWRLHVDELTTNTGSRVTLIDIMDGEPAPEGKTKYDIADLLLVSGNQPGKVASLVNIAASNGNGTYRQYIDIDGQTFHLLLYNDGREVLPADAVTIEAVQLSTGLKFAPANIMGFACMVAPHYN